MGDVEDEPHLTKEEPAVEPDGKETASPAADPATKSASKPEPGGRETTSPAAFHNILVTEVLRHVRDR